jgi:PAS domain S-box-containing protein
MPKSNIEAENNSKLLADSLNQIDMLKNKVAQLEGIQSAMPDPYYIRDMDYNIVLWPQAIAKLTGYSEFEATKLKCYEIYKASVCPPANQCPTQNCIKTRQFLRDVAVDIYHKSGATIHSIVSNAGVYDEAGNPIGAVEIVKDNTAVHSGIQTGMVSIGETIKNIESVSHGLTSVIDKVSAVSSTINEKAHESLKSVEKGVEAGNSVFEKVKHSGKYATSVHNIMKTINDSMNFSVDKISALKSKSEAIIQFVTIIQDISSKTNLLAINASIEAAHAGESGRGFKVVADGIRELSKNSNESAQSIKGAIQEITGLIKEATTSLNVTEKDIETGTNTISDLLTFVNDIDEAIKMLLEIIDVIERASVATVQLDEEQEVSMTDLTNVGRNLINIAEKLTNEFNKLFAVFKHDDMG